MGKFCKLILVRTENKAFGKPNLTRTGKSSNSRKELRELLFIAFKDLDVITCITEYREQEKYINFLENELKKVKL